MSDHNIDSTDEEVVGSSTPIWLIIIKWVLVVINCMWIFGDSIAIIMGKSVSSRIKDFTDIEDSTLRIQASIELGISLIGLIGLIGHKFFILVFHCIANTLYYITIYVVHQNEMFVFTSAWILMTAFYAYHIWFRKTRPVLDTRIGA